MTRFFPTRPGRRQVVDVEIMVVSAFAIADSSVFLTSLAMRRREKVR